MYGYKCDWCHEFHRKDEGANYRLLLQNTKEGGFISFVDLCPLCKDAVIELSRGIHAKAIERFVG